MTEFIKNENTHPLMENLNGDERIDKVNDGITIIQRKNGLVFGSDALLLAGYIRSTPNLLGVELGGGTGIISLLAAKRNKLNRIYIYEIQPAFASLCQRNAELNCLDDRITVINKDVRQCSLFDVGKEVDVVFSNPPYMKMGAGKENLFSEKNIARRETAGDIFDFCKAASSLLKFGGSFYIVYLPERLATLTDALIANNLEPKRLTFVCPDMEKRPCLILMEAKKGGKPGLFVTPPLYIRQDGKESLQYRYIMENGDFNELYKKI